MPGHGPGQGFLKGENFLLEGWIARGRPGLVGGREFGELAKGPGPAKRGGQRPDRVVQGRDEGADILGRFGPGHVQIQKSAGALPGSGLLRSGRFGAGQPHLGQAVGGFGHGPADGLEFPVPFPDGFGLGLPAPADVFFQFAVDFPLLAIGFHHHGDL